MRLRQQGVGLVEVMIAAAMLGIAVVGTSTLMVDWVQSLSGARVRSDVTASAVDCLERSRFSGVACENSSSGQDFSVVTTTLNRTANIADAEDVANADDYEVTLAWSDPFASGESNSVVSSVVVLRDNAFVRPSEWAVAIAYESPGAGAPAEESNDSDVDTDQDGVPDSNDLCPDEGTPGNVDADGCAVAVSWTATIDGTMNDEGKADTDEISVSMLGDSGYENGSCTASKTAFSCSLEVVGSNNWLGDVEVAFDESDYVCSGSEDEGSNPFTASFGLSVDNPDGTINLTYEDKTDKCDDDEGFEINDALVTVYTSADSNGSVAPSAVSAFIGETTALTVTADDGYTIASVAGCGGTGDALVGQASGSYNTGALTESCTVSASFTPVTYVVSASDGAHGVISGEQQLVVQSGGYASLSVTPDEGYELLSASGSCTTSVSGNDLNVGPVTSDCSVEPVYVEAATSWTAEITLNLNEEAGRNRDSYTISVTGGVCEPYDSNDGKSDDAGDYPYSCSFPVTDSTWTGSITVNAADRRVGICTGHKTADQNWSDAISLSEDSSSYSVDVRLDERNGCRSNHAP